MTDRVSAWDQAPADLEARGYSRDPRHLFGRLQRVATWDPAGPVLGREGRELVGRTLDLRLPEIVDARTSADGATRCVLELGDGERIEAVHMPRAVRRPRVTICLSSQVGCAVGCTFCATARMGLRRNLAPAEIVGQLLRILATYGPRTADTLNLVFMGMGEPLHNVEAVIRALDILCDPAGLGVAPSRITVSTAGHLGGLARLAHSRHVPQLAVSVNATTSETRRRLIPIEKRWPLEDLREALAAWPLQPHDKLTFEYVLLSGVNDTPQDADRLANWVGDLRGVVNLIPFNPWERDSPYAAPPPHRVEEFAARVRAAGRLVKIRHSRGSDVRAACGTLAAAPPTP